MSIALFLAASAIQTSGVPTGSVDDIVVTASLQPVAAEQAPVSASVLGRETIERLGLPLVPDLVRTTPGVSVAGSGARGALTQIRIRGAEANHSLLFVDGIAFNDPASGNQARFDTLTADGLSRIEIVRGPQSALWGSEALGGVIALETPDPMSGDRIWATAEYGGQDSVRGSAALVAGSETSGVSANASYLRSDGIDIFGGGSGDRDGFENFTASLKAVTRPGSDGELGIVTRYISAESEFDGTPAPFFIRADTNNSSQAETAAVRGWAALGLGPDARWAVRLEGQYLRSENRNFAGRTRTNDTVGDRFRARAEVTTRLVLGDGRHSLIAAVEREDESFANIVRSAVSPAQSLNSRGRTALVGEWRAEWADWLNTDLAVRRDDFDRFEDATTFRAGLLARLATSLGAYAVYGEGIAQPSFADLYGFSPGSAFVPNPALRPERSTGYEAGLRWTGERLSLQAAAFSNDLEDEIVEDFESFPFPAYTVVNANVSSRRRGIELSADLLATADLRLSANYTYLDAREGADKTAEIRRAKHSANATAEWTRGPLSLGASASYVGKRRDRDFDLFPAPVVTLDDYALASLRIAYRLAPSIEAYGRLENAFGADYQDAVGYNTPGRTAYAGIRLRFGD